MPTVSRMSQWTDGFAGIGAAGWAMLPYWRDGAYRGPRASPSGPGTGRGAWRDPAAAGVTAVPARSRRAAEAARCAGAAWATGWRANERAPYRELYRGLIPFAKAKSRPGSRGSAAVGGRTPARLLDGGWDSVAMAPARPPGRPASAETW